MKKILFLPLFFIAQAFPIGANNIGRTELDSLDQTIKNKQIYVDIKKERIGNLKQMLQTPEISSSQVYEINKSLFYEFKTFNCDSAFSYAEKNLEIAVSFNHPDWIDESKLHLSAVFYIIGMYKEALDMLNSIDKNTIKNELKINYYNNYKEVYGYYSSNNNVYVAKYKKISDDYRDSLLSVLNPASNHYLIVYAEKLLEEGKLDESEKILTDLLAKSSSVDHEFAVLNYAVADVYRKKGDIERAKTHFTLSAEADMKNAIKENASMQALALLLYETGDLNRAYEYIKCSLEDAIFCNARLRTVEISKIFPVIDTAYQEQTIKQKKQLMLYLALTAVLSFFLMAAVFYVYKQMKKLAIARKELHGMNLQLKELNAQLVQANSQMKKSNQKLFEANHLKEEYIGHFLDLCSTYINKLDTYRKMLFKKASASQWEALFTTLKSKDFIERELEELYNYFDNIFLHLYPDFIEEFNQLLMEEERFTLKQGELLNPELRIFALFRLGISDSSKIAAFLHYSASTIYNYRTKVRNKAVVERDEFETRVMEIGSVRKLTENGISEKVLSLSKE